MKYNLFTIHIPIPMNNTYYVLNKKHMIYSARISAYTGPQSTCKVGSKEHIDNLIEADRQLTEYLESTYIGCNPHTCVNL